VSGHAEDVLACCSWRKYVRAISAPRPTPSLSQFNNYNATYDIRKTDRFYESVKIHILTCCVRMSGFSRFGANRLQNGSPYAMGPLSFLSALSVLSVTLVYCGQTIRWIKMKLDMHVGLGPGHIVLGGDPAPVHQSSTAPPPIFSPYLLSPNGRMD